MATIYKSKRIEGGFDARPSHPTDNDDSGKNNKSNVASALTLSLIHI